jgi:DNA-binding GntR family transcriptional regulator
MSPESAGPAGIPRATYASLVTERLRDSIIKRELSPGQQLSEVELAKSYGVSRGPVREALQRLIQEGLLISQPHRGVFVPVLSDEDVEDIYLVREALESAAMKRIIGLGRLDEAYAELNKHVTAMEAAEVAGDWELVGRHDLDFHAAMVEVSRSPRLQRSFGTLISETRLCLGALTTFPARDDLVEEHRQIIERMRENDAAGALEMLKIHFDGAVVTLKTPQDGVAELSTELIT